MKSIIFDLFLIKRSINIDLKIEKVNQKIEIFNQKIKTSIYIKKVNEFDVFGSLLNYFDVKSIDFYTYQLFQYSLETMSSISLRQLKNLAQKSQLKGNWITI